MLTSPTRRAARPVTALLVLLLGLFGSLLLAAPAQAAERTVTITADGLTPRQLTIAPGDSVVLVNEDVPLRYRAMSTTANWSFDSGLLPLTQGQRYALPEITSPGTYGFTVLQGEEPFNAAVVRPAPRTSAPVSAPAPAGSSPAPSPRPSATQGTSPGTSPATSPTPAPAGASPTPAETGGSGAAALPPLTGGFGTAGGVPRPPAVGVAQAPALAPALPGLPAGPAPGAGPAPQTAGAPTPAPAGTLAIRGDLPGAGSSRGYGLPAALAAVLAAGVASLLVRLLLAEPVARRAVAGLRPPGPVVTVE